MLNTIMKVISYLPGLITGVEQVFGRGNGKDKQQQVVDASLLMLNFEQRLRDKGIADEQAFRDGLAQVNDGVHKMLKASKILEN